MAANAQGLAARTGFGILNFSPCTKARLCTEVDSQIVKPVLRQTPCKVLYCEAAEHPFKLLLTIKK